MNTETQSTSQEESPTITPSLEQLGQEIMARIAAGEKASERAKEQMEAARTAQKQANDRFLSAGRMLIEARDRLPNLQAFEEFLRDHCGGLSRSRAYDYIGIAKGRTSAEEIRAETNERKRRHRATKKAGGTKSGFRSTAAGTETVSEEITAAQAEVEEEAAAAKASTDAVAEVKRAIDRCFPVMDDAGRREIATYVAGWSVDGIPEFLKRAA